MSKNQVDQKAAENLTRTRLRHYPAYKPSGVAWLGDIPSHWEVKRLKDAVRLNPETLPETTDPDFLLQYVDISNVEEISGVNPSQEMRYQNAPSRARRIVRAGDTILSTVRTYLKAIAYFENPPENLIVSTGFAVLRPNAGILPQYLYAVVRSKAFIETVVAHSVGVGYPAINPSELACLPIWFPPLPEQRAIAAYLDRETAHIDALVAKNARLIELLQEKRTALISHAVTRGVDANVPLKDSGVEWLGKIPEHWEVKPFKTLFKEIYRYPTYYDISYVPAGVLEIRGEMLGKDGRIISLEDDRYISNETNARFPRTVLEFGDIVMSVRGTMGKIGLVDERTKGANITANMLRLSPKRDVASGEYLRWLLLNEYFNRMLDRYAPQTTIKTITMSQLAQIALPIPPLEEQRAIGAYLDRETAKIDALVGKVRQVIEKLQEYRTALISAAVTGKIQVPRQDVETSS